MKLNPVWSKYDYIRGQKSINQIVSDKIMEDVKLEREIKVGVISVCAHSDVIADLADLRRIPPIQFIQFDESLSVSHWGTFCFVTNANIAVNENVSSASLIKK